MRLSRCKEPFARRFSIRIGSIFSVDIDMLAAKDLPMLQEGSRVRVAGLCLMEAGDWMIELSRGLSVCCCDRATISKCCRTPPGGRWHELFGC